MSAAAVLLASGGGALLGLSGYGVWTALRPARVIGVPLLRYRIVGPPRPGSPLNEIRVPMSCFEGQLRHLARRGHRAVTLGEAAARRRDSAFLAQAPLVFVFEGPYRDAGGGLLTGADGLLGGFFGSSGGGRSWGGVCARPVISVRPPGTGAR